MTLAGALTDVTPLLYGACALVYAVIAVLIGVRARHRTGRLLALCCLITAGWATTVMLTADQPLGGPAGAADLLRALCWYGFILHLYRRSVAAPGGTGTAFSVAGALALAISAYAAWSQPPFDSGPATLFSVGILVRIGLAVAELLLIENLYFNMPRHARWHVALPCVLLGGLACFDILRCGELVLFYQGRDSLEGARVVAMMLVAPLLMIAASRERRGRPVQLSRTAAFHSATLVLSGAVLMALSAAGEAFRQFGPDWAWLAKITLLFAGAIAIGVVLTSGSARSRLRRAVLEHFFASRYDYRRQWLDSIDTLSDAASPLHSRAIRALADVVDSPNGALFLRDGAHDPFAWTGSWNMPSSSAVPCGDPLIHAMRGGEWIVALPPLGILFPAVAAAGATPLLGSLEPSTLGATSLGSLGQVWLAIPLLHRSVQIGVVVVGPPRAPFILDQEVYDLLRILGREVATYIAEQRATQILLQTRQLHDYSKRFAFVAHDIKNVSSQLSMLLSNAERHIANPAFQQDMLHTVNASVNKITALLRRLDTPEADRAPSALAPLPRLEALVATYRRARKEPVVLEQDGSTGIVAMSGDAFDACVTHLLNNAVDASAGIAVVVRVRHEAGKVVIDIADRGPGMTEAFIRDHLFQPFLTSKQDGSGIGAFQARELLREAGGTLEVISAPGAGTTMRLSLARVDAAPVPVPVPVSADSVIASATPTTVAA